MYCYTAIRTGERILDVLLRRTLPLKGRHPYNVVCAYASNIIYDRLNPISKSEKIFRLTEAPVAVAWGRFDFDRLVHELEHDVVGVLHARSTGNGTPECAQARLFCHARVTGAVIGRVNRARRVKYQLEAAGP